MIPLGNFGKKDGEGKETNKPRGKKQKTIIMERGDEKNNRSWSGERGSAKELENGGWG